MATRFDPALSRPENILRACNVLILHYPSDAGELATLRKTIDQRYYRDEELQRRPTDWAKTPTGQRLAEFRTRCEQLHELYSEIVLAVIAELPDAYKACKVIADPPVKLHDRATPAAWPMILADFERIRDAAALRIREDRLARPPVKAKPRAGGKAAGRPPLDNGDLGARMAVLERWKVAKGNKVGKKEFIKSDPLGAKLESTQAMQRQGRFSPNKPAANKPRQAAR
jgi:hypothetical protein